MECVVQFSLLCLLPYNISFVLDLFYSLSNDLTSALNILSTYIYCSLFCCLPNSLIYALNIQFSVFCPLSYNLTFVLNMCCVCLITSHLCSISASIQGSLILLFIVYSAHCQITSLLY